MALKREKLRGNNLRKDAICCLASNYKHHKYVREKDKMFYGVQISNQIKHVWGIGFLLQYRKRKQDLSLFYYIIELLLVLKVS